MRAIRDITKDVIALGVCKIPSIDDMLSQIKSNSCFDQGRVFASKKEWAYHLGICEMTVIRWEKNIITPNLSYRVNYWNMKGNIARIKRFQSGKNMGYRLDYFQRFVLSLIRAIKLGAFTYGIPIKYDYEVVAWIENTEDGQYIKRLFDRDAFQQSTKNRRTA